MNAPARHPRPRLSLWTQARAVRLHDCSSPVFALITSPQIPSLAARFTLR